eukprot:4331239-Pyramimonas_sp.AAC.1
MGFAPGLQKACSCVLLRTAGRRLPPAAAVWGASVYKYLAGAEPFLLEGGLPALQTSAVEVRADCVAQLSPL